MHQAYTTTIEATDEKLLEAARTEPNLLDRLKGEARDAFLTGRTRVTDHNVVDQVWNDLRRAWQQNRTVSDATAPNCAADKKARADDLRATQKALEYFKGLTGEGLEKPLPPAPTALLAQRLSGIFDSPLEVAFAAASLVEPQDTSGLRQTFTPHHHVSGRRRPHTEMRRVI